MDDASYRCGQPKNVHRHSNLKFNFLNKNNSVGEMFTIKAHACDEHKKKNKSKIYQKRQKLQNLGERQQKVSKR